MSAVPPFFFFSDGFYRRVSVVVSDDTVIAFNYGTQSREHLPRMAVRRWHKRALRPRQAAQILNVSIIWIKEAIKKQLIDSKYIGQSYNLQSFRPTGMFISVEGMYELRDILWDKLPKNKYGVPNKDSMPSKALLEHRLASLESDNFISYGSDGVLRIFTVDE